MPSTLRVFRVFPRRKPAEERRPPPWKPASERSHKLGLLNEASDDDWTRAEAFCKTHSPTPPKLLPSNVIEDIQLLGCAAWGLEFPSDPHFVGRVERGDRTKSGSGGGAWKVCTEKGCQDTCVMSDLPIMAGLYDIHRRRGVYYEIRVNRMDGVIAIGMLLYCTYTNPVHFHNRRRLNNNFYRHGVQAIPILASAWVESSQCRLAPRRSAQVLRRLRRRARLLDRQARTFSNFSRGRHRLRIRVRQQHDLY